MYEMRVPGTYDCSHPRHAIDRDVEEAKDAHEAERVHVVPPARDPHRREHDGVGHEESVGRHRAKEEGQRRYGQDNRAHEVHLIRQFPLHVLQVRLLELRILEPQAEGALLLSREQGMLLTVDAIHAMWTRATTTCRPGP